MKRTVTVLAAAALAVAVASCSSSPSSHHSDAAQTGAGGAAELAGQPPGEARGHGDVLRLGFVAVPANGIALVGVQDQLIREDLGADVALHATPMASSQAAEAALVHGRVDAAYLSPVAAVAAWQATHGRIRVVAGAALAHGRPEVALVVTTWLLAKHPLWVQGLLKGQVQAMLLLTMDPLSARRLAAAELTALGQRTSAQQFARQSVGVTFTCDPLPASVLAQARQAASAHDLQPVRSLARMYDLVPVNELLKSAGLDPVTTTAS
jgi:hypothetical protein